MKPRKVSQRTLYWAVALLGAAVIVLGVSVGALLMRPVKVVSSFEQCQAVGGALLESYPEQCLIQGATFVNPRPAGTEVQPPTDRSGYVGLSEADALAKAKQAKVPARVVERDDEALPVTMDFVLGRHNFHVKNGTVTAVDIEGSGTDTPAR